MPGMGVVWRVAEKPPYACYWTHEKSGIMVRWKIRGEGHTRSTADG